MSAPTLQRLAGKFIVFDGVDGAGKGMQIRMLADALRAAGVESVVARDPGGTAIGDRIRHVLLDYDLSQMDVRCEALLFMASRAQLVGEVIRPATAAGKACLGDRYVSATCAYQGAAGCDPRTIVELARFAVGDCWPHLTIILDVPLQEGLERTGRSGKPARNQAPPAGQAALFHDIRTDAIEARPMAFHRRVRELFLELPKFYPAPIRIIDAAAAPDEVHRRVLEAVDDAVR